MKKAILLSVLTAATLSTKAAPLRILATHLAKKANGPIVIDGKLDESDWKNAPEFTAYRYGSGPVKLKTSMRIIYDRRGIYLGVVNYEDRMDRLKTTVYSRDGKHIWTDDSAEFYIDPTATANTMFKFDVNSAGAIGDFWQVDPGFTNHNWSASSAESKSLKYPDRWTIEFFVSWQDLKKTASPGDVWLIMHQRFSTTHGKLCASSTSGGNFYNRRFGYLFFIEDKVPTSEKITARCVKTATAPWLVYCGGKYHYFDGHTPFSGNAASIQKYLSNKARTLISVLAEDKRKELNAELKTAKTLSEPEIFIKINAICQEAKKLHQQESLKTLFE